MLFSMSHPLGVTAILSVIGVSFAMVVNRDAALDRKRIMNKCSGYVSGFIKKFIMTVHTSRTPQDVYLNAGQDVVLQNPGFESGEFIEGCTVSPIMKQEYKSTFITFRLCTQ
jgi:hypothetical protein